MGNYYRKPHRYKIKKSFFRRRPFWLAVLILIFLFSMAYLLFFSSIFQVQQIMVEGAEKLSPDEVKALVEKQLENKILFLKTRSIFLAGSGEIGGQILDTFPLAAGTKVSRWLPNAIQITIQERKAVALWCQTANCFALDGEGVIFEEALPSPELIQIESNQDISSFILGEQMVAKDSLSKILDIKEKLQQKIGIVVQEAEIVSAERLNITTTEGWEIYFNPQGDLDWQVTELTQVLEKQISQAKRRSLEYIDLRFSKVYYK